MCNLRGVHIILTAVNMMLLYVTRNCLSVAIVSMAQIKEDIRVENATGGCQNMENLTHDKSHIIEKEHIPTYTWSHFDINMVLGSYYYAYALLQIPSGVLLEMYSPRKLLVLSKCLHALLTCLIPITSEFGPRFLMLLRFLTGAVGSIVFPATFSMLKKLSKPTEVMISGNLIVTFAGIGSFIQPIITGYLCSNQGLGGWKSAFYILGGIELSHILLFAYVVNTKQFSKNYLANDSSRKEGRSARKSLFESFKLLFDWKVYAYSYSAFASYTAMQLLLLKLPDYFSSVLNYNIRENGYLNSLPMFFLILTPLLSSAVLSRLHNRGLFSARSIYSFAYSLCMTISLILTFSSKYFGCNGLLAVAVLSVWLGFSLVAYSVIVPIISNHSEFVALSSAVANTFALSPGFISPLYTYYFTKGNIYSAQNWHHVFLASGFIGISGILPLNLMLWIGSVNPYLLKFSTA